MTERMKAAIAAAEGRLERARAQADIYNNYGGLTAVAANVIVGFAEIALAAIIDDATRPV